MEWKIPLFKCYWDENDIKAVGKVIKRGTYWASGPEIDDFEKEIAQFIGKKYAITFNSGTSALHSILKAYNIKKNDEVIVPSFTFIATANAPLFVGAKPVFAETENETFGLDYKSVVKKISEKTKAIIPLHYGGIPSRDINMLREISEEKDIILIEDAAESFGAKIKNKMVGTFGDSAIFSFCQNKVITTGEGGAIATDEKEIFNRLKLIRSHGRVEKNNFFSTTKEMDYILPGYNFRMPSMIAALGLSQLKKIKKIIDMRRENAVYLNKKLANISEIKTPKEPKDFHHVYQLYTLKLKNKAQRDGLQKYLSKKGIMTKIYFEPVHLKTLYKEKFSYKEGDLPKTEELSKKVLTLPMYPHLSEKDMNYIVKSIKEKSMEGK